jgi:hypothetical protein
MSAEGNGRFGSIASKREESFALTTRQQYSKSLISVPTCLLSFNLPESRALDGTVSASCSAIRYSTYSGCPFR